MAVKIFLAIALAGWALAQPAGSGVISGMVIDNASGDPVGKAVVTVTWQGTPRSWATSRTDGSGKFRFEGLPPGKYALRAAKAGIGVAIYGAESVRELGDFLTLGDGETLADVKLHFVHSASISGRVLDQDGDPVPGANVRLLRPGRNLGVRILGNYQNAMTNDRGEYRFTGIDPGEYYARTMPVRSPMAQGGVARRREGSADGPPEILLGVFYGGTRMAKDASPLNIRGGENLTGIDFHLLSEPAAQVHVRLSGIPPTENRPPDGNHLSGGEFVQVEMTPLDEEQQNYGGSFGVPLQGPDSSFDVPQTFSAGHYRLRLVARDGEKALAASQTLDLHPGVNEVAMVLSPAMAIKGQVHFEGPPLPGAPRVPVMLTQPGVRPLGQNAVAQVGNDGRFTLAQVFPGQWEVDVNAPRGSFLKSVRYGDKDVLFSSFEIASADAPINVVISTNMAKLEGEVDAAGADSARAGIVLAPVGKLHGFARYYYGVAADSDGKFKLEGIAPGKYRIFAVEKMAPASFRTPEAADKLEALGEEIEFAEGKTTTVHPKLIRREQAREVLP